MEKIPGVKLPDMKYFPPFYEIYDEQNKDIQEVRIKECLNICEEFLFMSLLPDGRVATFTGINTNEGVQKMFDGLVQHWKKYPKVRENKQNFLESILSKIIGTGV